MGAQFSTLVISADLTLWIALAAALLIAVTVHRVIKNYMRSASPTKPIAAPVSAESKQTPTPTPTPAAAPAPSSSSPAPAGSSPVLVAQPKEANPSLQQVIPGLSHFKGATKPPLDAPPFNVPFYQVFGKIVAENESQDYFILRDKRITYGQLRGKCFEF